MQSRHVAETIIAHRLPYPPQALVVWKTVANSMCAVQTGWEINDRVQILHSELGQTLSVLVKPLQSQLNGLSTMSFSYDGI